MTDELEIKRAKAINAGQGPAFPSLEMRETSFSGQQVPCYFTGMTKREYAAIHAMAGLLADPNTNNTSEAVAGAAIAYADALLKALEEE